MSTTRGFHAVWLISACLGSAMPLAAQTVETVGSRSLGMGGAFVAVANDSSATWWNPAGLAAGPFLDMAIARTASEVDGAGTGGRNSVWSFSLGTPPFGVSYYRLRITDIRPLDPTAEPGANREDRRAGVSVSQFGATILQTLVTGVHAGATVKFVHGAGDGAVDLDVGVLAVAGALRLGGLVRNVREPEFGGLRLSRQVRVGAAFDGEALGMLPLMLAVDADLRAYDAGNGERRVLALGAERWLFARRVGVRGGARFNTAGAQARAITAGGSIAMRAGLYVDGHLVQGDAGEDGWGVAARVSF
jgi:hypothetical protein